MPDAAAFMAAYDQTLTPLFAASTLLSLVQGAAEAGVLSALRQPTTVADLVAATGLDEERAIALCRALSVNGVVHEDQGSFVLTAPWQALTDPSAFVPLDLAIAGNDVEARLLRAAAGTTYWSMAAQDRLTYARAVSPDPYSDDLVAAFRAQISADPLRRPMLDGGRLLELGCGVAGRLLTTLRAVPALSAVGVELSEDLAAEAERRARDLGVDDRLRIVCVDAASFTAPEPFDFGFWSQFFFPAPTRQAALDTLRASLRSGARFEAPVGVDFGELAESPDGPAARHYAMWRVVLTSWGVPERTPDLLQREIETAGFTDVRLMTEYGVPRLSALRP